MLIKLSLLACLVGVLAYFFLNPNKYETSLNHTDRELWDNFTAWLTTNGVTNFNVTLAYFEDSGRGLAVTRDIEEGEVAIEVPFRLALTSERFKKTELGLALKETNPYFYHANYAVFFSVCLLYERIREDSFWKPYIKLLPTDFSNMPLYFMDSETAWLDGSLTGSMETHQNHLHLAFKAASKVEEKYPKFKGIADVEGLKWALSTIKSRVFDIPELGGGTMIPLVDFLNHNPYDGKPLDIVNSTGIVVANKAYKKGGQFYLKYYSDKSDSDSTYFMTYGFVFNTNDTNTYQIAYSYYYPPIEHEEIENIMKENECGDRTKDVLTDEVPMHFLLCLSILSLDQFFSPNINNENFVEYITPEVKKKVVSLAIQYVDQELAKFTKRNENEEELLQQPHLSFNARSILHIRASEKKLLNNAKEILHKKKF